LQKNTESLAKTKRNAKKYGSVKKELQGEEFI